MPLPQNVPAVPLSASPVAFSPIAVPQKPAAQPKGKRQPFGLLGRWAEFFPVANSLLRLHLC